VSKASADDVQHISIQTSFGKLNGKSHVLQGCDEWLGIPYAKPPIGPLRFADPVPWETPYPSGGRMARFYGSVCSQLDEGEEDCLFVNVWRPSSTPVGKDLATLVWIHGGAFVFGGTSSGKSQSMYDGCELALQYGVIVASMNYRLGPLGFAVFDDVHGKSANFGIKDQRQALKWLNSQLKAFGGNPAKVTIFGESAGGISVFHHVASPLSKDLFQAAISESGFPMASPWERAVARTHDFVQKMNCSMFESARECLRKKDVKALIAQSDAYDDPFTGPAWGPAVDGCDMPAVPFQLYRDGKANAVPVLWGTNTDEGNLFMWPPYSHGMSKAQFHEVLQRVFDGHMTGATLNATEIGEVISRYMVSGDNNTDLRNVASSILTDESFLCGTRNAANYYSLKAPVFMYRFNHRSICDIADTVPGVAHTAELVYVWGRAYAKSCLLLREENSLRKRIQSMWTDFAKYLDPTPSLIMQSKESFPRYLNNSRSSIIFQTPFDVIEKDYRDEYCAFWEHILYSKLLAGLGSMSTPAIMV